MIHLILLSAFLFTAHAHELCSDNLHPELQDLMNLQKALEWTAASDSQINNAPCTRKNPFTENEMKGWMEQNDSQPKYSKTIHGINFENESYENLESFKHLTTYVDSIGLLAPERQVTFSSECKKVECAVKEILGNDIGLQLLYMQRRYGLNGSHIIREEGRATAWHKSELDTVLLALSDFPDGVLPFEENRTLIHAPRDTGNNRTIANAIITVYQLWNKQSVPQQRSTIVHELGHAIAGVTDLDEHPKWLDHSGWEEQTRVHDGEEITVLVSKNEDAIVSEYGLTNPREDLAEAVVAYRYNPQGLKSASPGKYDLLKEVMFDNVEYTSQAACSNPDRVSNRFAREVAEEISSWNPTGEELLQISRRCTGIAVNNMSENSFVDLSTPEFQNCYQRSVVAQTGELLKAKFADSPHLEFLGPMLRNAKVPVPQDILSRVATRTQETHRQSLRDQLLNGLKNPYFCHEGMEQYAYQKFDEAKLGINSFHNSNQLNNIARKVCQEKARTSANRAVQSIVR